jgi:hypothetical protein
VSFRCKQWLASLKWLDDLEMTEYIPEEEVERMWYGLNAFFCRGRHKEAVKETSASLSDCLCWKWGASCVAKSRQGGGIVFSSIALCTASCHCCRRNNAEPAKTGRPGRCQVGARGDIEHLTNILLIKVILADLAVAGTTVGSQNGNVAKSIINSVRLGRRSYAAKTTDYFNSIRISRS